MGTNAGHRNHQDKLWKLKKVQKMRATMPMPQRAGIASQALERKNGRGSIVEHPFSEWSVDLGRPANYNFLRIGAKPDLRPVLIPIRTVNCLPQWSPVRDAGCARFQDKVAIVGRQTSRQGCQAPGRR